MWQAEQLIFLDWFPGMYTHTLQQFIETVLGSGTRNLMQSDFLCSTLFWLIFFFTRQSQVSFSCCFYALVSFACRYWSVMTAEGRCKEIFFQPEARMLFQDEVAVFKQGDTEFAFPCWCQPQHALLVKCLKSFPEQGSRCPPNSWKLGQQPKKQSE